MPSTRELMEDTSASSATRSCAKQSGCEGWQSHCHVSLALEATLTKIVSTIGSTIDKPSKMRLPMETRSIWAPQHTVRSPRVSAHTPCTLFPLALHKP